MSTAILHAGTFIHDFNDLIIKVSSISAQNFSHYFKSPHGSRAVEENEYMNSFCVFYLVEKHMFFSYFQLSLIFCVPPSLL
jgi:hypothetical protein